MEVLQRLGSREMQSIDVLKLPGFAQVYQELQDSQHGDGDTFPFLLHRLVTECTDESIVRFVQGRILVLVDKDRLVREILPQYYQQTKWGSLQRQLHNYGFQRIAHGPFRGAYYHPLFLQDHPALCAFMQRVRVKKAAVTTKSVEWRNVLVGKNDNVA